MTHLLPEHVAVQITTLVFYHHIIAIRLSRKQTNHCFPSKWCGQLPQHSLGFCKQLPCFGSWVGFRVKLICVRVRNSNWHYIINQLHFDVFIHQVFRELFTSTWHSFPNYQSTKRSVRFTCLLFYHQISLGRTGWDNDLVVAIRQKMASSQSNQRHLWGHNYRTLELLKSRQISYNPA